MRKGPVIVGIDPPDAYAELHGHAQEIESAFDRNPAPDVPCHNDLLNANFLRRGDRIFIVDYEYAGMGDPFFDLGNLSINHEFDDDADAMLLDICFDSESDSGLSTTSNVYESSSKLFGAFCSRNLRTASR